MEREAINIIRNINKKVDDFNSRIQDYETYFNVNSRSANIKVPVYFDNILAPNTNGDIDIGTPENFIRNLYIDGKIVYPDKLDFGINNDFVINKIGKIGFHKKDNLNAISLKNIPTYQVKRVEYIGDNSLYFKIDENISEYITVFDILKIKSEFFQVIEVQEKIVKIKNLSKNEETSIFDDGDTEYDLTVFPSLLGIYTHDDSSVLQIDGLGDIFYKTDERIGNINLKGLVHIDGEMSVNKVFADNIVLKNKDLIDNLNAEFLGGKSAPSEGEIVGTKEKQVLWNKSFGDVMIMKGNRIMELGDPIFDKDAVTKRYVDGYLSGLQVKIPVKCCSSGNLECTYDHENNVLISRIKGKISGEYFLPLFDHFGLQKRESVLILNQTDEKENGIYMVLEVGSEDDFFILERRSDFSQNVQNDKLKGYYVFCENGTHFGNYGYVFSMVNNFKWNYSPILFYPFSKIEQINFSNGLTKIKNNVTININDELFKLDDKKLSLMQNSIDNNYLKNPVIYLKGSEGIELSESTVKLGDTAHINLKVNSNDFVFGKNGELKIAKSAMGEKKSNGGSNQHLYATHSIQNVFQLFPPPSLLIKLQVSDDYYEKEKEVGVQYFITSVNDDGKETHCTSSDKYYISKDVESIFATIQWEEVKNSVGYYLYRKVDNDTFSLFLKKNETEVIDILSPISFSKLNWKIVNKEPPMKNETIISINKISSVGHSFINSGNVGFGTSKPFGKIHVNSSSEDISLIVEGRKIDKNTPLVLLNSNGTEEDIPNIKGIHGKDSSSIFMGKDVKIDLDNEEGVVYIGKGNSLDENMNDIFGSNIFSTQIMDGGLYVDGSVITKKGNSYGTLHNKIGNNAAILKTGCQYNSIGNEISFSWEDDNLYAVPYQDGNQISKKKINVKNFVIDHPQERDKYLIHACLEGPTADVFYRGRGQLLDDEYETIVKLPTYFISLVEKETITVLLTSIDRVENICVNISRINENIFIVKRKTIGKKLDFFWEVKATRKNEEFPVEPNKTDVNIKNIGPYSYII